ncbi:MAG: HAMP domain-containing histidine kinase [Elusimicrobia bacterium]|nr:HAMP domain-containing histidine kinase [Elusimicrobiota bacterium]
MTSPTKPLWEDLALPKTEPQLQAQAMPQSMPASYLTHELRAPVTAIRLGLEILLEQVAERLQGEEKQILSLAIRNTARLESLVNDILDYSKIAAGKMALEKRPCDARALLSETAASLQSMATARGVKLLKEEGGEPLPRVSAEPRRVVQILTNLISNGIKFTSPRGRVAVSAKKGEFEHEGTVVFRVKDAGPGIPAQNLKSIFEAFTQVPGTPSAAGGTGLGLALSKRMVELHGGQIWAESWPGAGGASFYFTIPIVPEDMGRKITPYPEPVQYSGLLVRVSRRISAFLALFV